MAGYIANTRVVQNLSWAPTSRTQRGMYPVPSNLFRNGTACTTRKSECVGKVSERKACRWGSDLMGGYLRPRHLSIWPGVSSASSKSVGSASVLATSLGV
ncbi:hypothetical protein RRG08_023228 [Elysia crispata]|uniref:Uncharacterized protein n=1 Tax=Elysia crispata TaxID=231223 RepID=A0AAE0ZPS0_9GAST|nr:hypothetical protein RRG08_023228 [Elysia crispata]